ncbi:MAG: hypothetical protein RL564_362, partial [Pseudomonadota bacterium]
MRTCTILLALLALPFTFSLSTALAIDSIEPQRAGAQAPVAPAGVDIEPQSLPAQPLYVQSLAATCANCHGTDGHALSGA